LKRFPCVDDANETVTDHLSIEIILFIIYFNVVILLNYKLSMN